MTITPLSQRKARHKYTALNQQEDFYLSRAIRKYGWDNFEWEMIDEHEDVNVLKQLERLHISRYESNDPFWGYNITDGGDW